MVVPQDTGKEEEIEEFHITVNLQIFAIVSFPLMGQLAKIKL
jgi:hypothetical protein